MRAFAPVPAFLTLALALTLALVACARGPSPAPEVSVSTPPPAGASRSEVDTVMTEVTDALETARGVRDALTRAAADPTWDRVERVCTAYPLGPVDAAFGVRLTEGFHVRSSHPAWWPEEVVAIDSAAAVTCFITGAARSIPPSTRIDNSGPTTAEIASQSLIAAFAGLRDASLPALRAQIEQRSLSGA
jgi:hypothetical protein